MERASPSWPSWISAVAEMLTVGFEVFEGFEAEEVEHGEKFDSGMAEEDTWKLDLLGERWRRALVGGEWDGCAGSEL